MDFDANWLSLLITTSAILLTGYVSIIRRIDNNKKAQEIRDLEIDKHIQQIQAQFQQFSASISVQFEHLNEMTKSNTRNIEKITEKIHEIDKQLTAIENE